MAGELNNKNPSLSEQDKKILNAVQNDLPLTTRPFQALGAQVGLSEQEVVSRIKDLQEQGFIRRLGGVFNSNKLGFASTLVALQVSPEKLEEIGRKISALDGVTHNYQRDHAFNLWFTLVSPSQAELEEILANVENFPGVMKLRNLPALKLFKIGVNFKL